MLPIQYVPFTLEIDNSNNQTKLKPQKSVSFYLQTIIRHIRERSLYDPRWFSVEWTGEFNK